MNKALLAFTTLATLVVAAAPVSAEEPVEAFLNGLRNRGYFDTADTYLDRIARDPDIPAAVKSRIPYERAVTISAHAMSLKDAGMQHQLLDKASAQLEQFIKNNPGHERLGDALSRRGKILLNKASVTARQAKSPPNAARKAELVGQAVKYIEEARRIFDEARKKFKAVKDKFPKYISPDNTKLLAARERAELDLMNAQINYAKTSYEEAQIYKPTGKAKDPRYTATLQKAAREFDEIHKEYRTQVIGLYAQMWQGKCFEEQGKYGPALGIYNQLLDHPSKSRFYLGTIKPQTLSFKLICLNDSDREDYFLVEQSAEEWLKYNRQRDRTQSGLRIRFELARAREKLGIGASEKTKVDAKDRPRYLRLALKDAEYVNRYSASLKDATTLMVSRIKRKLGLSDKDPTTFPDAFSTAKIVYTQFNASYDAWRKAVKAGKPRAEQSKLYAKFKDDMNEAVRLHKLALKLAKPNSKPEHVHEARHLLAFVLWKQQKVLNQDDLAYDAAVLAEFVGRNALTISPETARKSSFLAMAAYISLYNKAAAGDAKSEMRWIIDIAQHIIKNWPGQDEAIEAALILGNIYNQKEQWLLAARWYARTPANATRYADSLLNAGTNYWGHYSMAGSIDPTVENYRRELKAAVGDNPADAFVGLLNPAYTDWNRVKRLDEVDQLLNPSTGKGKAKVKLSAKAQAEIGKLQAQSVQQLKAALAKYAKSPAADLAGKPESELRDRLFTELDRKTDAELRKMFDARLAAMNEDELKKVFQSRLEEWQSLAAWHLAKGVRERQKSLDAGVATPEDLTRAKVALAEYSISRGEYKRAVALLTAAPHDVMAAIEMKDGKPRPKDNSLKSAVFASAIYQILAQAYVGARELDKFKDAMKKLEGLVAGGSTDEVTRIYTRLGRDLQKKIERLQNENNEERLKEERDNFRWVVQALTEGNRNLDYNTLVWIGETSSALGEGLGESEEAKPYFEQAAKAYESALTKNNQLKEEQRLAIQLRLISSLRRQQEFEKAMTLVKEVLKAKPRLLPAQIEAARTLEYWARNKNSDKYVEAIVGDKEANIWGWQNIGEELKQVERKLQDDMQQAATPAARKAAEAEWKGMWQRYLVARYTAFYCRTKHAESQNEDAKRRESYTTAKREILAFASTVGVIKDDLKFEIPVEKERNGQKVLKPEPVNVKKAFNDLYDTVQRGLGVDEGSLAKIQWAVPQVKRKKTVKQPVNLNGGGGQNTNLVDSKKTEGDVEAKKDEQQGSGVVGMIFGVLFLLAGLGGGGYFLFKSMGKDKGKRRRMAYAYGGETPTFTEPTAQPSRTSGSSSSGTKTRRKRPAEGQSSTGKKSSSGNGGTAKKRPAGSSSGNSPRPKRTPPKKPE